MRYAEYILKRLLDKYERSQAFISGDFVKRIALVVVKDEQLTALLESAEEKEAFLEAVYTLQSKQIVDFIWVKFEKGNLIERIWLLPENLAAAYSFIGRRPKLAAVREIYSLLEKYWQQCCAVKPQGAITCFLAGELEKINTSKKGTRFFPEVNEEAVALLKVLAKINNGDIKTTERLLSVELYGDSKYFERCVKSKLLSVLRLLDNEQQGDELLADEDLLLSYGISRWPEIYEFLGRLKVTWSNEQGVESALDYGCCEYGAYIDSVCVAHITKVEAGHISRVMFIENKANYEWYKYHKQADELVVYHGGHYGMMKGVWFKHIYTAVKAANANAEFYHWSDIDLGGFNIFVRLKRMLPELKPWQMDCATLEKYVDKQGKVITEEYKDKLLKLLGKAEFAGFYAVINMILQKGKTLEQEQIIAKE